MGKIISTERLKLQFISYSDKENIIKLAKEEDLYAFISENEAFSKLYLDSLWDDIINGNDVNMSIALKNDNKFIGRLCMQDIDDIIPELGIELLKLYHNNGYATEAVHAFCAWYAEEYGINAVKVKIDKRNTASLNLFSKLGAKYIRSSSVFSEEFMKTANETCREFKLSEFYDDSVREYILKIPINN